ncbi:MAG: hypothetical protein BGO29_11095 [Bacteroidales bacterium 36-12]|nr:MAG: hypothetical protein BGO29_11095 [Bacteroidales bacterium 36-12]
MRYKRNRLPLPKTDFKAPADFYRNDPDIDENMKAVVVLWLFGGMTKKAAWITVYRAKCKPNSIPPQVSNFFQLRQVKEMIELFRDYHHQHPYINPKAWERK